MTIPEAETEKRVAVLIAGPTASGKSALALALAEQRNGIVLNADSMQVYADLRILTARPNDADIARAPHALYGHVDADTDYSVGRWVEDARAALERAWSRGQLPILVGGTGLYFRALTQGLAEIPAIPEEIRAAMRKQTEALENPVLHQKLAELDPEAASRLNINDRQRILRALEVVSATGRPLSQWQKDAQPPFLKEEQTVSMVLEVEREVLRAHIDERFHGMINSGALQEVEALAARKLPADRTILKAHGAPALSRYLRGDINLDDAILEGQGDTRRYAKRQVTFFRHQMRDWPRSTPDKALNHLLKALAER